MGISLSNKNVNEATLGIEIGTLSNDLGATGTYSINSTSGTVLDTFSIIGNKLSLSNDWFFDFESKYFINFKVTQTNGRIIDNQTQAYYFGSKGSQPIIPIKFTPDTGSAVTKNIQLTVIDQNETITTQPIKFNQNQYGAVVAEISTAPNNSEATYIFNGPDFFEISGNKLKLTDDYFFSENGAIFKWTGSNSFISYDMSATNTNFNLKLITASKYEPESTNDFGKTTITHDSYRNSIFGSSNVEKTPLITLTPIQFYDKVFGATIAKISFSGDEEVQFSLENQNNYLEISGDNLKLKNDYYYDSNTSSFTKQNLSYLKQINASDLNITATNKKNSKKISTEKITMSEVSSSIFGSSNVLDKDESYTYVTDIKIIDATTPRNTEHQKLISKTHWKLDNNETISYSFLGPGSSYDNTQSDIKEFSGLIAVTDAFKAATKSAFDIISSFANITFKEISETGTVTGDFRIGIANKDAFVMDEKYGAYSHGVTNFPKGGNIFFNGTVDKNGNGIVDYNEADQVQPGTWHFATFLHEICHSLGLKHSFEDLNGGTTTSSEIFAPQFDQYRYTLMSYTPIIDQKTYADYEGILLNQKYGTGSYYPDTIMLYDIMSLQEMYGKSSNQTGNNTYSFEKAKPPFKAIYDTGGTDTLDLSKLSDTDGTSTLDLSGNKISIIGSDYLQPWKNEEGKSTSTYGDYQGSSLSIIAGTEIEKVMLPNGSTNITTGSNSTFIVGNTNGPITANINSIEIGIKSDGNGKDTINLSQTSTKWGNDVQARNMGNNGKGATSEEITTMSNYIKHDISLDLKDGVDTLNGTSGNDALFLQNFSSKGNEFWFQDAGSQSDGARLLGLNKINLKDGNDFLDLTSTKTSLSGESIEINAGLGNDIVWSSDGNEIIDLGDGDDQITFNGGSDTLVSGLGSDVISISTNTGTLTISDLDITKDKFKFYVASNKVSATGNKITVNNSLGDYVITLSNNPDLSDIGSFSTFV